MKIVSRILNTLRMGLDGCLVRETTKVETTPEEIQKAIDFFWSKIHEFKNHCKKSGVWSRYLSGVECHTSFGGCGYVQGRQEGFSPNRRIKVVEADDDMDFSEVCVVFDNIPCLLLYSGRKSKGQVTIVAERDFLLEVFGSNGSECLTVDQLNQMAAPVRAVLLDVFLGFHKTAKEKDSDPAIEALINYINR